MSAVSYWRNSELFICLDFCRLLFGDSKRFFVCPEFAYLVVSIILTYPQFRLTHT